MPITDLVGHNYRLQNKSYSKFKTFILAFRKLNWGNRSSKNNNGKLTIIEFNIKMPHK